MQGEGEHDEIGKRLRVLAAGVGLVIVAAMWGYNQEPESRPFAERPAEHGGELPPVEASTTVEARMENMCREAIADRRIRGVVDVDGVTSAAGSRYEADFENTRWAHSGAAYAVGDWEKDEPSIDWVIAGSGEVRELQHWRVQARFGAGSPGDSGALVGRVWCLLVVDPETGEAWFRRRVRDPDEDEAKHFWLTPGEPEALVMMEYWEDAR